MEKYEKKTLTFAQLGESLKLHGRTLETDGGALGCDWTGSGVELNLDCKGQIRLNLTVTHSLYICVYIDGEPVSEKLKTAAGTADILIADNLPEGMHNLKILKVTAAASADVPYSLTLNSLTFSGEPGSRPEQKKHYIEIIGDSLTTGAGVLGTKVAPNNIETGHGLLSYAFLAAQSLDVDYSIIGVGGAGAVRSYNSAIVPKLYEYTSWCRGDMKYDFPRKADLVVVNLGSNDGGRGVAPDEFETVLEDFIRVVVRCNENPKVVIVNGMSRDIYTENYLNIQRKLGGEAAGFYYLSLPTERNGAARHPNRAEQSGAGKALSDFIKSIGIERQ